MGIVKVISDIIAKHKEEIRDRVAHEVIGEEFSYEKEKESILTLRELTLIKSINTASVINFLGPNAVVPKLSYGHSPSICPLCSNKLVKRKGTYGIFMGCKSYPKCRYTRKK